MTGHQGSIPRSFIESLLARSDIVQVISLRVPLKKAGASYKACCPFHGEKTPSFNVSSQKQLYHCFGCGASGDALKFMMEYDGLSFVEAIEMLAAQNGMDVPREKISPEAVKLQRQQRDLYDVMHLVAKFYRNQLKVHKSSEDAKQYIKGRGLTSETAKNFVIGLAPPGWSSLAPGLQADETLRQELILSGMLVKKEGGQIYDRFRHRIMFPIRDGRGRVIAFGGRVIDNDQPKYLNSPETPIFHKSEVLYGLYEMRQSRQVFNHVLVVEGYMDVVVLAQFGICNAVATLGTATTMEHLELLFRESSEIIFCFDGDKAGIKAAWKALELALPRYTGERVIKFLFLDEDEDPDSTIRKEGVKNFQKRIAEAMLMSDFLFKKLKSDLSVPLETSEGRHQYVARVQPYIVSAPMSFQDVLTEDLSRLVGLPVWRLGQIMGLRVSSTKRFEKHLSSDKPRYKVTHLILKLTGVLFKHPEWAAVFSEDLLDDLSSSEISEYRFFAVMVVYLKKHDYSKIALQDFFLDPNRQDILKKIKAIPLKDEEKFLVAEYSTMTSHLVMTLESFREEKQVIQNDKVMTDWFKKQVEKKGK